MKAKQLIYLTGLIFGGLILSGCQNHNPRVEAVNPKMASPAPSRNKDAVSGNFQTTYASAGYYQEVAPKPLYQNTEKYGEIKTNPVHEAVQEPVSTFSIDVDTGSYANVRRFLNSGKLPPENAVRVEELINYFPYQYALPKDQHPFGVTTEITDSPWNKNARIIRVGIKASDTQVEKLPPANLVFLVDTSGSMYNENKLPLVKTTLRMLAEQLRPQDRVSIVTYSGYTKVELPSTSGANKEKIISVLDKLHAAGSTAGGSGIKLAYEQAEKGFIKGGINRIVLMTDGDFNVGITDFDTLKNMVAEKRKTGISLSTFGYGTGNYNEKLMEQIADAGNGNYSYIDNEKEAKKVMVDQLSSTLSIVASDVKIQVEFNPKTVTEYRLIGYENRTLNKEDFNNDKVDAGEIGAGHTVTALYEIIPAGNTGWNTPSRYQEKASAKNNNLGNEYAFLRIRYKPAGKNQSILMQKPVSKSQYRPLAQSSEDMRFVLAVAAYGQLLRQGTYTGSFGWDEVLKLAQNSKGQDPYGFRQEFIELIRKAKNISSKTPQ